MTSRAIRIRPATRDDIPGLFVMVAELASDEAPLDDSCGTEAMLRASLFPDEGQPAVFSHVAVDESTEELLGNAIWHLNFSTREVRHGIYVEDLFVVASGRGSGIGVKLLAELARISLAEDYVRLQLSALIRNKAAIRFYERMGGQSTSEWVGYTFEHEALEGLAGNF